MRGQSERQVENIKDLGSIVCFEFSWQHRKSIYGCVILMRATLILACIKTQAASAGDVQSPVRHTKLHGVFSSAAATH